MRHPKYLAVLIGLILVSWPVLAGDEPQGFLTGRVIDVNGAPVAGAEVTIVSLEQGFSRSVTTMPTGDYRFPALTVGSYEVSASAKGFQTTRNERVQVNLGDKTHLVLTLKPGAVSEVFKVTAETLPIDVTTSVSGLELRLDQLEGIPLVRDQHTLALLAAGSVQGDESFDINETGVRLSSIGGASVAENAYLVNGLHTTNFRNGLGGSLVPFEMLEQVQIKTGGYDAEFGRSLGGVLNTATRSGTNELRYGLTFYWEPESLGETKPDTYQNTHELEQRDIKEANLYVSGPIVKDKAFYYVLYNPRDREAHIEDQGRLSIFESDDAFWGGVFDWYITPEHSLKLTVFSDQQNVDEQLDIHIFGDPLGDDDGVNLYDSGGENVALHYSGILTPNLVISAQYGINEYDLTKLGSLDEFPVILDYRNGPPETLGTWSNFTPIRANDKRRVVRLDVDYYLGKHAFRAGFDFEDNTSYQDERYSGGVYYRYDRQAEGNPLGVPAGTDTVQVNLLEQGGSFDVRGAAFYLQDDWAISEHLHLNLGIRYEQFDNRNAAGRSFIKIDDQWAPRLGFVWDPSGEGTQKVYGHYGRYHLPVPTTVSVRFAGVKSSSMTWYLLEGLNADDTPVYDANNALFSFVEADNLIRDPGVLRDGDLKPMYQDELTLGYDVLVDGGWKFGVRGVARELGRAIEDIVVDTGLNRYMEQVYGITDFANGFEYIVAANPGDDVTLTLDIDGDGVTEEITIPGALTGFPEAERKYYGLDFTFRRERVEQWSAWGSYTWSHSYGNYEGRVNSDRGNDTSSLTTSFDLPVLLEGAYGNLPNDRRHNVKLYGDWQFKNGLTLGSSLRVTSGRPVNAMGVHPTDFIASFYGSQSFYRDGVLSPRGSAGTTDTITNLDLRAFFPFQLGSGQVRFSVDIFNVLNGDGVTRVLEDTVTRGQPEPNYGMPRDFQEPRYVRFGAELRF